MNARRSKSIDNTSKCCHGKCSPRPPRKGRISIARDEGIEANTREGIMVMAAFESEARKYSQSLRFRPVTKLF
jgi:hypothetical protein